MWGVKGSIAVSIGATLGATASFLAGRYLARDRIAMKMSDNKKFAAIDQAVGKQGWKIVLLTRLSPVFPFHAAQLRLRSYSRLPARLFFASWIGMMPGTVMYVYVGSLARAAGDRSRTPAEWALHGIGLLATVVVAILVTRIARKALKEQFENSKTDQAAHG